VIRLLYINDCETDYSECKTVVTIGNFDGFHKGHKKLIETVNNIKTDTDLKSLVLSFYPRPVSVLRGIDVSSIFVNEERTEMAESLGVDILVDYPFTKDFAALSGAEFIGILKNKFSCRQIVVGEDFAFGKNRMWNAESLLKIAQEAGITVTIKGHEYIEDHKISSTDIRNCLKSGDIEKANHLMGHDFFLRSIVNPKIMKIHDSNFSTVIIVPPKDKLLPKPGAYIVEAVFEDGETYLGWACVGNNAILNYPEVIVETYIQNFDEDIKNKTVKIKFKKFAREEIKFESEKELLIQAAEDMGF